MKRTIFGVVASVLVVTLGGLFVLLGRTQVVQVADGAHVLRTSNGIAEIGANVTVLSGDQGLILVDTQLAPLARRLRRIVAKQWTVPVRTVVNSHWHPDHTGGNELLGDGIDIVAHPSVQDRMTKQQEGFGLTKPGSHHTFEPRSVAALPTALVSDAIELTVGHGGVHVQHVSGAHTDGDLVVYADGPGVLVIGDLVWPGSFPFIDVHNGGSAAGLSRALEEILGWLPSETVVVPGHGPAMTTRELIEYSTMVRQTLELIEQMHTDGIPVDDAQIRGLPADWERWSSRLVPTSEWIRMVYASFEPGSDPSPAR